jgi:hypothetical protein
MNTQGTRSRRCPGAVHAVGLAIVLPALVMACGSSTGGGDGGVDCTKLNSPCVDLMNFSTLATNIFKAGEQPGAGNLIPPGNPGLGHTTVNSAQGAKTSFTASRNGTTITTVECTVGPYAWVSINPSVVLQQGGALLTCAGWSF